jgi:hypothetical protein
MQAEKERPAGFDGPSPASLSHQKYNFIATWHNRAEVLEL